MTCNVSYVNIAEAPAVRDVAVVIDVLRAFTTAAWAFHLGVERIVLTGDLEEALRLKAALPGALALKDGEPQPGFDLTNSPVRLQQRQDLAGRTIVQRTTHGTIGAVAARNAALLYCSAFPTAKATAAAISASGLQDVSFVITGDLGADEDLACAEYIAALLDHASVPPDAYTARVAASGTGRLLHGRLAAGSPGVAPGDIEACTEVDLFDFAMRATMEDGMLVLRRVEA